MTLHDDSTAAAVSRLGIDATGTVTTTFPCRQCGYDLQGLHETGRCPECGVPVGLSLREDLLQFSQPEWVESLRLGVRLILWSMLITFVGVLVPLVLTVALNYRSTQVPMMIVIFAAGIVSFVGSWRLTTPDPSGLGEDQYGTRRKLIRIGLAVGLSNYVLTYVKTSVTMPPTPALMIDFLSALVELFSVIASFALLNYLSKLALRIPDIKLSGRAKFLMYAMGISQLFSVAWSHVMQRVLVPAVAGRAAQGLLLFSLGTGTIGICMLVFAVMYLFLLLSLRNRFKDAAASARSIWQGVSSENNLTKAL